MWQKGDPWRVVEALQRLNAQIRAACPRAIPPATPASAWGSIADDAHATTSDHYPHYYSVLGPVAVVCARDFPHAPELGLDAHAIAEAIRVSQDTRVGYVISNARITGPNHGWRWDPYGGSDPHDTHIHVSSVHTAAADNTGDWQIGEDMSFFDEPQGAALDNRTGAQLIKDLWFLTVKGNQSTWLARALGQLGADVKAADVDEQQIAAAVLATLTPQAIAAAIPDSLAAAVANELARRLVA